MSEKVSAIISTLSTDPNYHLTMHILKPNAVIAYQDIEILMHTLYSLCEDEEEGIRVDYVKGIDKSKFDEIIKNADDKKKEAYIDAIDTLQNIDHLLNRLRVNNVNAELLRSITRIESVFERVLNANDSVDGRRFHTLTMERSFQVFKSSKESDNILKNMLKGSQEE